MLEYIRIDQNCIELFNLSCPFGAVLHFGQELSLALRTPHNCPELRPDRGVIRTAFVSLVRQVKLTSKL